MELPNQEQTTRILWGRGLARYLILTNPLHISKVSSHSSPNSLVNRTWGIPTLILPKLQPSASNNSWADCHKVLEYSLSQIKGSLTQIQQKYQTKTWKSIQFQTWYLSRDSPCPLYKHNQSCFHEVKSRTAQSKLFWVDDTS